MSLKITPIEGGSINLGDRVFWERRLSPWERFKFWLQDWREFPPPRIIVEDAIVTATVSCGDIE